MTVRRIFALLLFLAFLTYCAAGCGFLFAKQEADNEARKAEIAKMEADIQDIKHKIPDIVTIKEKNNQREKEVKKLKKEVEALRAVLKKAGIADTPGGSPVKKK
jgi:hypothetical protein